TFLKQKKRKNFPTYPTPQISLHNKGKTPQKHWNTFGEDSKSTKLKIKMDYTKNSISTLAIISLLLVGFIYISTLSTFPPKTFLSFQINPTNSPPGMAKYELEEALKKASMAEKTVIITVINKAYVEPYNGEYPSMFDLFLEGFWEGESTRVLLEHLLVVAVDQTAYERCKFRRLHCYRLVTGDGDFAGEKIYMSEEFIKMMWRRTRFLMEVLKLGYNFIFTA
ncbi:hypothetical protein AABB24_001245, partial [Solanum stoloniferum]